MNAVGRPSLSVGFLLCPNFTLVAMSAFVDALRLAADEGDRSRPIHCRWTVVSHDMRPIRSSSGVEIKPTSELVDPADFDYLVVVGGLTDGPKCAQPLLDYVVQADRKGVPLVGLCTGSFVLARLGLLQGRRCCVSWYHHDAFAAEFPAIDATSAELFVVDRNRITCAGGTSVVHAAAYLISKHSGRERAQKALRILIEEQQLAASTPQPLSLPMPGNIDTRVRKAVLLMEQTCDESLPMDEVAQRVHLSTRQLERLFVRDLGVTPSVFGEKFRLARARQLLQSATEPLYTIALKCGYKNASHFASRFRSEFGVSPSSVRGKANAVLDLAELPQI